MYRFQQRNWLDRQQMQEEEDREKARISAEAAKKIKDAEYDSLKAQYQQEKSSGGLLFPTSYHMQKTVNPSAAAAAAAAASVAASTVVPGSGAPVRMMQPTQPSFPANSLPHHPHGTVNGHVHHGQTQYSPLAPNSYFNATPIKQEMVDESLYPLDGSAGDPYGREDIFSETSSIDQEYDFSGVPSTTMSPFDPGMGTDNQSFHEGDMTANYLDFGGNEMETEEFPNDGAQNLSSSAPSSMASPQSLPVGSAMSSTNTTPVKSRPTTKKNTTASAAAAAAAAASFAGTMPAPAPGNFQFDFSGGSAFSAPVSGTLIKMEDRKMPSESMEDPLSDKKKKRRESHNAVERRRRDHINDRINELSELVPDCADPTQPQGKANKGVVLKKSADYIRQLQETNRRLQQMLQQQHQLQQHQHQQPGSYDQNGVQKMVQAAVAYPHVDANGQSHPESIS